MKLTSNEIWNNYQKSFEHLSVQNTVETAEKIYLMMVPYMGLLNSNYESTEKFLKLASESLRVFNFDYSDKVIDAVEKYQAMQLAELPVIRANEFSELSKLQTDFIKQQTEHMHVFMTGLQKYWEGYSS